MAKSIDTKKINSAKAEEKLKKMSPEEKRDYAAEQIRKIQTESKGHIPAKFFDTPEMRVTNKQLQEGLKPRNTDEDSLEFLFKLGITEQIDHKILQRARFNVDYGTKLRTNGAVIGKYKLTPIHEKAKIYNLEKIEEKPKVKTVGSESKKPESAKKAADKKPTAKKEESKKESKSAPKSKKDASKK